MRFRRKPIEIDAILWNGLDGVFEIIEEMVAPRAVERQANDALVMFSTTGTKKADIGDWFCKDIHEDTVFVLKPEAFQLMYDPVDEEEVDDDEIRLD